jgi:hypothetical protein
MIVDDIKQALRENIAAAVAAERERCAKIIEGWGDFERDGARDVCEEDVKTDMARRIRSGQ